MSLLERNSKFKPSPAYPRQNQRINCQLSIVNCQLFKSGFTLIEIVLSVFLILGIVSILFSASGTYIHSRSAALASTAAKIASGEIETLRETDFANLPSSGTFSSPDLSKLPSGQAQRTLGDYQGSSKIKQVTIAVSWQEGSLPKTIKMETLISESGI